MTAKDNCAEAANTSVCCVSGDKNNAKLCSNCNTTDHSSSAFSEEVRKKLCKAWGKEYQKCKKLHHFAAACKTGKWKEKQEEKKKAAVKVVTTVETAPPAAAAAPAVPAVVIAAPAAGLNSVQVAPQPAYTFNPERLSEVTDGVSDFWKLSTMIPVQTQRLWQGAKMEQAS